MFVLPSSQDAARLSWLSGKGQAREGETFFLFCLFSQLFKKAIWVTIETPGEHRARSRGIPPGVARRAWKHLCFETKT